MDVLRAACHVVPRNFPHTLQLDTNILGYVTLPTLTTHSLARWLARLFTPRSLTSPSPCPRVCQHAAKDAHTHSHSRTTHTHSHSLTTHTHSHSRTTHIHSVTHSVSFCPRACLHANTHKLTSHSFANDPHPPNQFHFVQGCVCMPTLIQSLALIHWLAFITVSHPLT